MKQQAQTNTSVHASSGRLSLPARVTCSASIRMKRRLETKICLKQAAPARVLGKRCLRALWHQRWRTTLATGPQTTPQGNQQEMVHKAAAASNGARQRTDTYHLVLTAPTMAIDPAIRECSTGSHCKLPRHIPATSAVLPDPDEWRLTVPCCLLVPRDRAQAACRHAAVKRRIMAHAALQRMAERMGGVLG